MDNKVKGQTADVVTIDEVQDFDDVEVPGKDVDFTDANFIANMNSMASQFGLVMPGDEASVTSTLTAFSLKRHMILKAAARLKKVQARGERRTAASTPEEKKKANKLKRKAAQAYHAERKAKRHAANKSARKPY